MPLTFANRGMCRQAFRMRFLQQKKNRDIAADYQQFCPDHTATNFNTLQNLLRILRETGFFPRVKAQRGHPQLVEDNVLGAGQ